uniref:Uncharacterized protein n=1 Tax=Arundo donax TaxID=35708 RepID=A0A0A9AB92_ARUDO
MYASVLFSLNLECFIIQ